jgi:hypothetical protein
MDSLRRRLPLLLMAALLAPGLPAPGQDLVGCALVEGQLSCVPGVSGDPQAQIRALRGQIADTLAAESEVQQEILGLQSLVLAGEAREGALLSAQAATATLSELPAGNFHWYRLTPGASHWVWISSASGPTYRLTAADVGSQVMVLIVQNGDGTGGVKRQPSQPVGPVLAGP